MDSSDDDFDMLPVKRRGPPVVAKLPNGQESDLHSINDSMKAPCVNNNSHSSDLNGMDDDVDLLPVKLRSAPKIKNDIDSDDPFGLPKVNFSSSDNSNTDNNGTNGLLHNNSNFGNSQNGLSFHDLNDDLDTLPVKRRGTPSKVNGESFLKHRGGSLGEDPFDNISIQVNGSPNAGLNINTKNADINGLSNVLQNEMLYNPLINVFDRFGLKEGESKKEEVEKEDKNLALNTADCLNNTNSLNSALDNEFQLCQEPVQRKPKGVSFDLEADLQKLPDSVNKDFSISNEKDLTKDFGSKFDEQFQSIESSDFINGLDFLEQCGGKDTEAMEELQRKSLYVRFDPLCETQSDIKQPKSTNDKTKLISETVSVVPDIKPVIEENLFDNSQVISSVNNLAKDDIIPGFNDPFSPIKQSVSKKADSDLKEVYPTVQPVLNDAGLVEPLLYTQSDMDEVIQKAKLDLDDDVHARELDWKKKYEELESKIKEEVAMRELIEQDYRGKIDCLRKDNLDMKQVLSQYERTIVELTENTHLDNKSNEDTLAETIRAKEQLQDDLNSAEQTLFDTLKRVEKLKQVIDTYKQNEEKLKENNGDLHSKLQKSEERYEKLREHVTKKIDDANLLISKERKQKEVDLAGLQAALKKAQNKANNLELEIQQKNLENQQLSQICDDLIKKVSGE